MHSQNENNWEPARLIPTIGIKGQQEQERRATSVLLSVMSAVPSFSNSLLEKTGAPKGKVQTFTEIPLKDLAGKVWRPDGAIKVARGSRTWNCLVEVKTGKAVIQSEQIGSYIDLARKYNFDSVITISNQIRGEKDDLPYEVDKRKVGKLEIQHISWWRVLTAATVQHRFHGVQDPEQAWILSELIHYLDHDQSGASGFEDMGENWVSVRKGAEHDTLRSTDKEVMDIAEKWEQFTEYLALYLSQDLGVEVKKHVPRGKSKAELISGSCEKMVTGEGLLTSLKIPRAASPLNIKVNLKAQRTTVSTTVKGPKDGRPKTRINWLLRQLKDAPNDLRIDVHFENSKTTSSLLMEECRDHPELLLLPENTKRAPRSFTLALSKPMGRKRGKTQGSFVVETRKLAVSFYQEIVQNIDPWQPKAPKITTEQEASNNAGHSNEVSSAEDKPQSHLIRS